ncbi:efflux RND transporter periplasmic adaptor subunit [Sphingomonas nostoxanthinifaciens]|uniref:efflux RND transporter periplasmic adaptor subunit n=1 Tax=Sphingomonas nostoxanthinifaciens TaxID=2872652 RepID=UPI001CC2084B|nr:efflux RND transporter periplasmic adaptor subunit [Sphingomonas nostoxanthinifaciens]UAK25955.1 efflux RND transporter periplasmic adaptor subunit [Sphingomonas nostoxanthinifaciens]
MQSDAAAPRAPKGLKTAGIVAVVVAIGVVAAGTVARHHDADQAQDWSDARSIPTVHLIPVKAAPDSTALSLPGTMQAWNGAHLYARVGGYLKAWYKDIGAKVGTGAVLGVIDTPELDQQIVQARAAVTRAKADAALARSTAARWNDLLSTNSVSHQEADEKNGALAARNAAVQAAEADLGRFVAMKSFATLRAPFAGTVTARVADIGDLVGPGATNQQPLFSIADVHRVRIYVSVPQAYSASMKQGLGATVTVPDYPGRSWKGQVIGSSGAINGQTGTFQVQLVTDNPGEALKPGGYALVRFDVPDRAGGATIPSSTLIFRAQGTQVATVRPDGHVHLLSIAVGRDLGGTVEIDDGLKAGMQIVDNPPDSIAEGELVRVGTKTNG